jgi:hypothetical protein
VEAHLHGLLVKSPAAREHSAGSSSASLARSSASSFRAVIWYVLSRCRCSSACAAGGVLQEPPLGVEKSCELRDHGDVRGLNRLGVVEDLHELHLRVRRHGGQVGVEGVRDCIRQDDRHRPWDPLRKVPNATSLLPLSLSLSLRVCACDL